MKIIPNLLLVLFLSLFVFACSSNTEQPPEDTIPEEVVTNIIQALDEPEGNLDTKPHDTGVQPSENKTKRKEILEEQIQGDPLCKLGEETAIKQYQEAIESIEKDPSDLSKLDIFLKNVNSPCWNAWKKNNKRIDELYERLSAALPYDE
jgi:hypothetical protein